MPIITPIQIYVPANSNANLFLFSNKNVNFSMLVRIKPLKYTFFFYNTLLRLLDYLKICQLFYLFKIFLNFFKFCIGVYLIYNVLVSGVPQSELVIHIHMYNFSYIGYCRILNKVFHTIQ